jgi:intracellular septation protein
MKMLFEFMPIILFFIAFKFKGIFFATGVAIAASIIQIAVSYFRTKKVDKMMWISLAVIVLFGGTTLILHNEIFIKWKPTVLYWIFAAVIGIGRVAFGKNIIKSMLGTQIELPEPVWTKMNYTWGGFFALLGCLNLYVAYNYPTNIWVNFKLFGILGLMLVFIIVQSVFMAPYVKKD